jgi:hypothetical protein
VRGTEAFAALCEIDGLDGLRDLTFEINKPDPIHGASSPRASTGRVSRRGFGVGLP